MDNLNIFKSILDTSKDMDTVATFQTMILAWDTGALFLLAMLNGNFVDYTERYYGQQGCSH